MISLQGLFIRITQIKNLTRKKITILFAKYFIIIIFVKQKSSIYHLNVALNKNETTDFIY